MTALHHSLPPNYLWPEDEAQDELSSLDILLAGPAHTPFEDGIWRLHFELPADFPQRPPTAYFRTTIFHPNVDAQTGSICVETLKRDWNSELTLRDLLVTVSCLLIQPNPDSALNAEAGALIQEDYDLFARRARLLASIHAAIPTNLLTAAREAQSRGQPEAVQDAEQSSNRRQHRPNAALIPADYSTPSMHAEASRPRPRRAAVQRPRRVVSRRSDGSPVARVERRRQARSEEQTSATHGAEAANDDLSKSPDPISYDQENERMQAQLQNIPGQTTPRRPPGPPVPLGEMILDSESSNDEMEVEYPPSPKKSPRKQTLPTQSVAWSPSQVRRLDESSSTRLGPGLPTPAISFEGTTPSQEPSRSSKGKAPCYATPVLAPDTDLVLDDKREMQTDDRQHDEARLWALCGNSTERWNRGDFDGQPIPLIASRW